MEIKRVSEWKNQMEPVLSSKVDELKQMGYSRTSQEEVWKCLVKKVWKGDPQKRLHQIVEDILHLGSTIYLSYLTVEAYQDDDLLASIAALTENDDWNENG
ncbi:post-transcriptional regulator [Terrihalobacillus insolitus]|uniref:post-transcriptional regulator n=1 Tax=Terrihalobacillus insolitus TaxID=2950438 RepID=UPI0023411EA9|nr:post-transcriptional regulator [Terrihalobacillus insolitus]MDC3412434.1 post-transcriptional regulator [Terrihalobacillus insolitus]